MGGLAVQHNSVYNVRVGTNTDGAESVSQSYQCSSCNYPAAAEIAATTIVANRELGDQIVAPSPDATPRANARAAVPHTWWPQHHVGGG